MISFGIGDPDLPTPQPILDELSAASEDAATHRYPESEGLPEFREAVADWYGVRFGVNLDPEKEALSLIGAKEGIGHLPLAVLDPGDTALVPDPGYPVYSVGTLFAGAESYMVPLTEENGWLPDLDAIPEEVARRASLLWINYPNNPTGATAELDFFETVVAFARSTMWLSCTTRATQMWPSTATVRRASCRRRARRRSASSSTRFPRRTT